MIYENVMVAGRELSTNYMGVQFGAIWSLEK